MQQAISDNFLLLYLSFLSFFAALNTDHMGAARITSTNEKIHTVWK